MPAPALKIPVSVDLDQFSRGMDEASSRVVSATRDMEREFQSVNSTIGLVAAGVVAAGGAMAASVFGLVTSLARIGDLSDDLRLPVNLIQGLSIAAAEARVPADELTGALKKFTAASKLGGDDADKLHKALGNVGAGFLTAFQNAASQGDRIKIVSNALKSTTDEVKRAQLALQVFGTDNERVIGIFDKGGDAIDGYIQNVFKLGLAIDESFVRQAQEAKSKLSLLSRVLGDEFASALADLIPLLTSLLPYIERLGAVVRDVLGVFASDATAPTGALKSELEGLQKQLEKLAEARDRLVTGESSKADDLRTKLRKIIGIDVPVEEEIKGLDDEIARVKARIETINKLLASRTVASITVNKPAFSPREPLTDKSRDRFDSAADSIEKRTAALLAEVAAIDLGTEARTRARVAAELETVAKQVNKEAGLGANVITDEQRAAIDRLAEAYGRATLAMETARSPLNTFAREAANVNKALNQFAASGLDTVTNELASVVTGTKSAADAFRSMAQSIINDLAKIAIRQAITGPIAGALGGLFGPMSQAGAGTAGSPLFGPIFPGRNAGGTDNWRGGLSWVGEKGPELLNLPRGSQVIPNDVARNMGGGTISAPINIMIDATGADREGLARLELQIARLKSELPSIVVRNVRDARSRRAL